MAKTMSIIRYKYKADRDFESVQFEGPSCPLGELKRLIIEKSIRSGSHHTRDDFDLIISNSTTHEEYKDLGDMIPRNTSVIVTRRMRGTLESLTPSTTRKPTISSDDIVNKYLRPVVETKAVPLEILNQPSNNSNNTVDEVNEEERLKQILKNTQSSYMPVHRSNTPYICHTCKQPGHLRNQCPLLLQSSSANATGHINGSSSSSSSAVSNDQTQSTSSSMPKSAPHASRIITNQIPYHSGHLRRPPRHVNMIKRPTGIPQDGLIRMPVPVPMPGVLIDKTGYAVVPKQMAALLIENSDKKADALYRRAQQSDEKNVLPSADEERPPEDLLCPICKQIYFDAVIAPCCHNNFCDDCIRNALINSEDHKCPYCQRQHVAIDQINPNLYLRQHVKQYKEERQQKSSYPYMSLPSSSTTTINYPLSQTHEYTADSMENKSANNQNLNESDEYDVAILPTTMQQPAVPIKNAPIVIKMKPIGRSPSPLSQPNFESKSGDIASEDDKTSDNDHSSYSQKEKNVEVPTANNSSNEESSDKLTDSNISENEKSDRHTPPSQVAPVSTILSSPPTTTTTTMASSVSVVPHYYPVHPHMPPHGQHIHPGMMYPSPIPPTSSTGLYSMQGNFYPSAMHVPYPGAQSMLPVGGMTHYPGHSGYPPIHPHHTIPPPHLQATHLNGYQLSHYEPANVPSLHHPHSSGSTLIPHANNSIIKPTLTEDEFYSKQRSLQRIKRSTSRRRSRSSSYSSHTSSASRNSFSRRNDRYRRRSSRSRSRSRQRVDKRRRDDNRTTSPIRQPRRRSSRSKSKQRRSPARRRSPSDRNRSRTLPSSKDNHSSNYRKMSPARPPPPPVAQSQSQRSTRDRERRRSPRPPPTALQSTQRTIVYSHDSSSSKQHSSRDNRRSKSRSRHRSRPNDDRTAPSSKTDHHSQSESNKPISPITVPSSQRRVTLSSIITPVNEENSSKKTSTSQSIDTNNDRKRKKTEHHQNSRKHRRHQSPNQHSRDRKIHHNHDHDDDDDDDDANIVVENTTADSRRVIEAQ